MTQDDAARLFDIKQPHLANLLRGHDGVSAEVAERVRHFVLDEAVTVRAS